MTAFDPAAAAAAYVQRLPPAALAVAPGDTQRSEILAVASVVIILVAAWAIARSDLLEQIRRRLQDARRPRWMADSACGAAAIGLIALALTPLAAISPGIAGGPVAAVILALRQDAVFSLLAAILAPLLYGLMRLWPRGWAPALGALAALAIFSAAWLPFAEASGPANLPAAPAGPARAGLLSLIADTHLNASQVYITPTRAIDADVTGLGAARVSVSRGLWETASPQELRASIGHLMGHYVHHDQLSIALLLAVVAFGLFLVPKALYPRVARPLGLGRNISDPSGAPALIIIATIWLSVGVVADHALIRAVNVRADQYSLDHAREPDGLAMTLLHEWKGEDPSPSALQEALFYDHPSLQSRLLHAMRWKAAHGG